MILTCPSCSTRYQTDGARFATAGRNVRCAKCGRIWFQPPLEIETEPEPEAVIEPPSDALRVGAFHAGDDALPGSNPAFDFGPGAAAAGQAPGRRAKPFEFGQIAGWAALIFLVVMIAWAMVTYRETIARLWPQSSSLYATLGMPVNVRGMALTNIAYHQQFEDGQPVLSITGKVVNVSNRELPVPEIRVVLTDDAKHELYHWTFDVGVPTLKPGGESPFMTRLSSPPPEARNLNVRFADASDRQ